MKENNIISSTFDKEEKVFNQKIYECEEVDVFNKLLANFSNKFRDILELRNFISYLFANKKDEIFKDILENIEVNIKSFREEKKV